MKKKVLYLLLLIIVAVTGCALLEPEEKTFKDKGMSITLTDEFTEKDLVSATVYFESMDAIVTGLKEEFSTLEAAGLTKDSTVEDYAKADYQLFNKGLGISPNMGNLAADGIHLSNARGNLYWTWTFNAWNASTFMNFMANGNVGFTTNRADLTTNWKIRFDSEKENYQLSTGSSLTLKAHSTTYAKEVNDETNFTIKVIDGEDIINVNNQSITAKKAGKAHIVLCFRTNLYMESSAKSYYIYSNVIEIDVK